MKWSDEYWPLLVKTYKMKPEGVKPLYSRKMIELALKLHIMPQQLHRKMLELRNPATPFLRRISENYASAKKLNKDVKTLLHRQGMGKAEKFYSGVETQESWEKDFRPIEAEKQLMPVTLIM